MKECEVDGTLLKFPGDYRLRVMFNEKSTFTFQQQSCRTILFRCPYPKTECKNEEGFSQVIVALLEAADVRTALFN